MKVINLRNSHNQKPTDLILSPKEILLKNKPLTNPIKPYISFETQTVHKETNEAQLTNDSRTVWQEIIKFRAIDQNALFEYFCYYVDQRLQPIFLGSGKVKMVDFLPRTGKSHNDGYRQNKLNYIERVREILDVQRPNSNASLRGSLRGSGMVDLNRYKRPPVPLSGQRTNKRPPMRQRKKITITPQNQLRSSYQLPRGNRHLRVQSPSPKGLYHNRTLPNSLRGSSPNSYQNQSLRGSFRSKKFETPQFKKQALDFSNKMSVKQSWSSRGLETPSFPVEKKKHFFNSHARGRSPLPKSHDSTPHLMDRCFC